MWDPGDAGAFEGIGSVGEVRGKAVRVLIVEDSELDAGLLLKELSSGSFDVAWERVETAPAMKEALTRRAWAGVISDDSKPSSTRRAPSRYGRRRASTFHA